MHGYLRFEPGAWKWNEGLPCLSADCRILISLILFKFSHSVLDWTALSWIFVCGFLKAFSEGSVDHFIYGDYKANRPSFIYCSLACSIGRCPAAQSSEDQTPLPRKNRGWNDLSAQTVHAPSVATFSSKESSSGKQIDSVTVKLDLFFFSSHYSPPPPGWFYQYAYHIPPSVPPPWFLSAFIQHFFPDFLETPWKTLVSIYM